MVLGPTLKTLLQLFYCSSWHQQGGTVAHQQGQVRREHHLSIPSSLASSSEGASYSFTPAVNAGCISEHSLNKGYQHICLHKFFEQPIAYQFLAAVYFCCSYATASSAKHHPSIQQIYSSIVIVASLFFLIWSFLCMF